MSKVRAILLRRWPVLVVTLVIGAIAGVLSSQFGREDSKPTWQAQQVVVSNRTSAGQAFVQQDALKVTRGDVLAAAAKELRAPDAEALRKRMQVTYDGDSSSIKITSTDLDAKAASRRVSAFTTNFLDIVNAQLLSNEQRQLEELKTQAERTNNELIEFDQKNGDISNPAVPAANTETYNALVAQRRRLYDAMTTAQQAYETARIQMNTTAPYSTLGPEAPTIETSILPRVPKSPLFRAGLVGFIGLLLGVVLVMIVERLNQRIDTRDELAEQLPHIPILAEIGHLPRKRMTFHEDGRIRLDGVWAEHYRRIRAAIQFVQSHGSAHRMSMANGASSLNGVPVATPANGSNANGANGNGANGNGAAATPRVFLFTSTLPGEGKSTSCALTSLALAEVNVDTLVINGDFRKPQVDKLLGAAPSPSLADRAELTLDRPSIDDVVQASATPHLWMAAGGPPSFEVGTRLEAAREVALEGARRGATVLIDSPPLRVANDSIDLFPVVDGLILIVRAGRTTQKSLADTMELLELHHAPILGVVLIGTQGSRELYAYYDSYYSAGIHHAGPPVAPPVPEAQPQTEHAVYG
jgi:Mrp family chromosome partitioning ATPase/capsular polysaccharide biosynthesis protein